MIKLSEKEKIELDWWKSKSLFQKKRGERGLPSKRAYNKYKAIILHSGGGEILFDEKVIVDVGCGPMGALHFFPQSAVKIGIDNLAFNYNQIFQVGNKQNLKYISADGEYLPINSQCVDYIFCINSLDHVDKPRIVLDEFERILKPGGNVFLQVEIDKGQISINEPHNFTANTILNLFNNFTLLKYRILPKHNNKFFRRILKFLRIYPRYEDLFIGSFKRNLF